VTRIVVDTNVFVSFFFGGNSRQVTDLWKLGASNLGLSQPIVNEYISVLHPIGLWVDKEIAELLALYSHRFNAIFTVKTPRLRVVNDDPEDDKFIEYAVTLATRWIITSDNALQAVQEYVAMKIVSQKRF
jgi:predicted nucleic acid-binding protein